MRRSILLAPASKPVLRRLARQEGAEAARRGRARSSNPYPIIRDTTLRAEWFLSYDQLHAELTGVASGRLWPAQRD